MRYIVAVIGFTLFLTGCGEGRVNPDGSAISKNRTEPVTAQPWEKPAVDVNSNKVQFVESIPLKLEEDTFNVLCDPANHKVIYVVKGASFYK